MNNPTWYCNGIAATANLISQVKTNSNISKDFSTGSQNFRTTNATLRSLLWNPSGINLTEIRLRLYNDNYTMSVQKMLIIEQNNPCSYCYTVYINRCISKLLYPPYHRGITTSATIVLTTFNFVDVLPLLYKYATRPHFEI